MNTTRIRPWFGQFLLFSSLFIGVNFVSYAAGSSVQGQSISGDGEALYRNYSCLACHGEKGYNPLPAMPKLGGQDKAYLINQLKDFKSGARSNGRSQTMIGYMETITDEEMQILAEWLSQQSE